jgi:hypothetical protein
MDIDEASFEPDRPDLELLCRDGKAVKAHSYLLAHGSAPLRPAIRLALKEAATKAAPPVLALKDDSAEAWEQALCFLDLSMCQKPAVTWVRSPLSMQHACRRAACSRLLRVPVEVAAAP